MKRRKFILQTSAGLLALTPALSKISASPLAAAPFLTTGIKIGEVDETSAIVWTRLTRDAVRIENKHAVPGMLYLDEAVGEWHPIPYFKEKYRQDRPDREVKVIYPDGCDVQTLDGSVPGAPGFVRISFRKKGKGKWNAGAWSRVDDNADFTFQSRVTGLEPDTAYDVKVEAKGLNGEDVTASLTGAFRTAVPAHKQKNIRFTVTTCH
ncbi:MAG: hypothetical protein ABUL46_01765, partial [Chitinophaga rupis]